MASTDSEKVWISSIIHLWIKISIRSLDPVGETLKFLNRKSRFQGSLKTKAINFFFFFLILKRNACISPFWPHEWILSDSFSWIADPLHDGMLTWRRWPHRWVCNKLFNLNRVRATSPHTAGILMWCYSPIYVLTDHQLSLLRLSFPSRPYFVLCEGNLPANYHHMCQVMGWSLRGLMSNSPHCLSPPISAHCSPHFMHLSPLSEDSSALVGGESTQVLRHLCFTPALSSTESKHGGQLQNLAMLAINHPLDCETQRDMGWIGNTLHCILFSSSSSYSFF